jgi:hypothetical protein
MKIDELKSVVKSVKKSMKQIMDTGENQARFKLMGTYATC